MGVRGLTTYINYNSNSFLHDHNLYDTNLVIDGHSLCAQIYRSTNSFSAFGGDYDRIASYVKAFFKSLKKCNVTPYIIFDGSYETRKLRTAYSRLRSKINGASRLDPVTQGSIQIFPLLLRDVFKEVLDEMNIMYTVCEFEADGEISALARCLNCPVLSYDSDFFIYNVQYIPFNTIDTKPIAVVEGDKRFYALECKIYKVEFLTKHFGGLDKALLPLLATLLGNDYVEKRVFRKFFSQMKMPKGKKRHNDQQRCIHGLFLWLQSETLDSAITKIIGRLKKKEKNKVLNIINESINGYYRKECRSLKFFNLSCDNNTENEILKVKNIDDLEDFSTEVEACDSTHSSDSSDTNDDSNDEFNDGDELLEENDHQLPMWFADLIRLKRVPHCFINLYTHHLHYCSPQAENYTEDDAHLCILPILRFAFDILTDFSFENFMYVSRDRDCNYKRMVIGNDIAIARPLEIPLSELTLDQLHGYFYKFFNEKLPNFDFSVIQLLPSNFQLFALSIIWWVSNCEVHIAQVHSLILCYTYLEAIDEKLGNARGHYHFNNKFSKKLIELKKKPITNAEDIEMLNKNKVQYDDSILAASVLLKYFDLDDSIRKKPKSYDSNRVHVFAQFQCCLQQINSLNVLCGCPFQSTVYSKCYNGIFIYNVSMKLENEMDPVSFIQNHLNGAVSVLCFYKSLLSILNRLFTSMDLSFKQFNPGSKKRRRRKKNAVDEEIAFLIKGFESDVKI
ncbi:protein asteroid [Zerene cesonia]|uniref:protein asteroid n=1 Tax=Zerene cesonia TaxID=33412 RepID=UPI0018E583F0|nr:protein asteroid [Zerene cesonia]